MTSARHDEAMTTPAVVAMTAWMEDTSLRNNTTQLMGGGGLSNLDQIKTCSKK